ncbi:MAG: lytic transglycosylase domain-containing protein [Anaerolineales bacterium]|nr:lytic transglycosylase domain-containing protein [Anaerolineales bacterium]
MPRARTTTSWQTAASPEEDYGSGCFSGFMIIPLSVILVSGLLASLALNIPSAENLQMNKNLSPIFTAEIQYWSGSIVRWGNAAGLDPNLIATIMQIESCGNPRAKSSAGALGLFQVMPFHFQLLDNPYNPETNAERGLAYLKRSLETANGNARLALAGYNGGIGLIGRTEWAWPAETKRYVQFGEPIYSAARSGSSSSEALQNWYVQYGVSLCRQANRQLGLTQ